MYIAAELDLDFDIAVKNEQARHSKMEEFKAMEKEMGDLCRSDINELEVSYDSVVNSGTDSEEVSLSFSEEDEAKISFQRSSSSSKQKIMLCLSADELVDCTSAVSACYRVGIPPQTSLIAAICNKAGVNLDDIPLSRATYIEKGLRRWRI